mgnify:CR=1 FL=1
MQQRTGCTIVLAAARSQQIVEVVEPLAEFPDGETEVEFAREGDAFEHRLQTRIVHRVPIAARATGFVLEVRFVIGRVPLQPRTVLLQQLTTCDGDIARDGDDASESMGARESR